MNLLIVAAATLVTLINFRLLGGSRLVPIIRGAAFQGVLLAAVSTGMRHPIEVGDTLLALSNAAIKGIVLPTLLLRALRQVEIRREVEPIVGYNLTLLMGAAGLGVASILGTRIGASVGTGAPLLFTASLFTLWTGLFLIVSRRKAVTQALGYLVFENGIYAFGIAAASDAPLLIEMGVLLDLLVAVFVMGIIIFHIQRDFSHIDMDRLSSLDEPESPPSQVGAS